jgi:hypothetical protein
MLGAGLKNVLGRGLTWLGSQRQAIGIGVGAELARRGLAWRARDPACIREFREAGARFHGHQAEVSMSLKQVGSGNRRTGTM